jgi:hypothetical protein
LSIILKLIISFLGGCVGLYLVFCLLLLGVGMPGEERTYNYTFMEKPKGFIKFSRSIGLVIIWLFIILIITVIGYALLFGH